MYSLTIGYFDGPVEVEDIGICLNQIPLSHTNPHDEAIRNEANKSLPPTLESEKVHMQVPFGGKRLGNKR